MQLHQLVYVSKMTKPLSDEEIEGIVANGTFNNHKNYLTGCLLYTKEYFMQYIEGDVSKLNNLYNRVSKDARHSDILLLRLKPLLHRLFQGYSVKNFNTHFSEFPEILLEEIKPSEYYPFPMSGAFVLDYFNFIRFRYPDKPYSHQFPIFKTLEKNS